MLFDSLIHLQDSQTLCLRLLPQILFDSLIHLQDSQTNSVIWPKPFGFDSLIHLQDSQTRCDRDNIRCRLIHSFTYKTLKPNSIR